MLGDGGDAGLSLEAHLKSQASDCRLVLHDHLAGRRWESGLVELEVMWDAIQRSEPACDLALMGWEVDASSRKLTLELHASLSRVSFRMTLALEEGSLRLAIPFESIREDRRKHYRVFGIRPLPGLLRATGCDVVVAPLRTGALIRPADITGRHQDQLLIYGQQSRWEDLPLIPATGVYHPGESGLAAVVESGDCDAQFELALPGDQSADVGMSFRYRLQWPDPVDASDRVIRYTPLRGKEAHYAGVGKALRRSLQTVHGVTTLREKAAGNPHIDHLARSLVCKTFHGMKELGHENGDGAYCLFQTFEETACQLRQLKAAGIDRVYIQMVGWNIDGHDGRYPQRFPVDERLGGQEGMRELVRQGQALGYQMQVHDNYVDSIDPDHPAVIRTIWGGPLARGIWGGGAIYAINPMKYDQAWLVGQMEQVKALGVAGVFYMDGMSPPLEVDHDPAHPSPRAGHAAGIARLMKLGRRIFGAAGAECAFAHVARHADYITPLAMRTIHTRQASRSPITRLVHEWVPVWHIAFHGLLVYAFNDGAYPTRQALLEAAETGAVPRSDFSGPNPQPGPLFATRWSDDLPAAYKAKYDILIGLLGDNVFSLIVAHETTGPSAYRTTFENGCVVEVDYQAMTLRVNGRIVELPADFK